MSAQHPNTPRRPGLDDKRYRENCKRLRTIGAHICAWCSYPIDMQLTFPHPMSWSADHIIPRSQLPNPADPRHWHIDNLQELHRRCNSARGAKPMPTHTAPLDPSIDW